MPEHKPVNNSGQVPVCNGGSVATAGLSCELFPVALSIIPLTLCYHVLVSFFAAGIFTVIGDLFF